MKICTYIRVFIGVMDSLRLSEHRFLGVLGDVVEGVEFAIKILGTDVLNNACVSPSMGDTPGVAAELLVGLQDWFIELFSQFSSEKRKTKTHTHSNLTASNISHACNCLHANHACMQNVTLSTPHSSNTNIPVLLNQLQVFTLLYFNDSVLPFQFPVFERMQTLISSGSK